MVTFATFVKADKVSTAVDTTKPISEDTWGEPTLSIDKNSYNTGLTEYNAEPEDVTADLYFRWDEEYLYIGLYVYLLDVTGTGDYWTGDGIQFKLQAGETLTSEASDICLTWGSGTFGVGGGNEEVLENSIQHNILSEDGSLSMMLAIPHSDMGYSEEEVKSGATYAIGLLRISGQGGEGASAAQAYSGWLEWGDFWGASHDLHNANCISPNTIVLYEKGSGSSGGDEQFSTLLDVTAAVGGTSAKTGFNEGMKVVNTAAGTYAVYMVRDNVFTNDSRALRYNEFQLYEIGEDSATALGLFYTRAGDVDILAGADGAIYVVGGSSSHVVKEDTVHCNDKNAENAVLNVWKYTKESGVLNGRTAQKPFESAKGYQYVNTVSSEDGSVIYSFYVADNSLVWFAYDIAAQKWIEGGKSFELSGAVDKSFVFSDESGITFVYSSGSSVYKVAIGESASESALQSNVGELKDAYVDTDGQLCLLYTSEEKVHLQVGSSVEEIAEMSVEDYGRMIQNTDGALAILAMEKGAPATVRVLSGAGYPVVKTIELDSRAVASIAPSIAVPRNGSDLDGTVSLIFPAPYRTSNHWYYGEIALN